MGKTRLQEWEEGNRNRLFTTDKGVVARILDNGVLSLTETTLTAKEAEVLQTWLWLWYDPDGLEGAF